MGKQNNAMQLITSTGAGIAIGTDIDLGGIYRDDTATTLTLKDSASTVILLSANQLAIFANPLALTGPVTCTSSGGNMHVIFRKRPVA